jgi:hypothetical protein
MPPYKIYSPRRPCTRNFTSQKQTGINKEITNKLTDSSTDSDNKYIIFFLLLLLLLLSTFLTTAVPTHQALRIHCSAKNFLTIRHALSITAFCIAMCTPGRRLNNCILSCNLSGTVTVVGSTGGIV